MKYKIRDRVRMIRQSDVLYGQTGVIKEIFPDKNLLAIELDYAVSCHDCDGITKHNRGWWVCPDYVELIKPTECAEREFKLIITSKGDTTTAKLIHGKNVAKEATVARYSKDEYSAKAAVEAVIKKLFGEDEKEKKGELFNGKAVLISEDYMYFTKGKIYVFKNGNCVNDRGNIVRLEHTKQSIEHSDYFLPIVE